MVKTNNIIEICCPNWLLQHTVNLLDIFLKVNDVKEILMLKILIADIRAITKDESIQPSNVIRFELPSKAVYVLDRALIAICGMYADNSYFTNDVKAKDFYLEQYVLIGDIRKYLGLSYSKFI